MGSGNLQDYFLNQLRKQKVPCTIFLTNGFQIKNAGIYGFDNFAILIVTDGNKQMLLYKHAVSSITPSVAISWEATEQN